MAKRKTSGGEAAQVNDYRHIQARRKNNPPAKIAAEGTVLAIPKAVYRYNPHLPPALRFDATGATDKLPRALNGKDGLIDTERFEALSGTTSLPFPAGKNRCVAVKVIDPRGNEVMSVEKLGGDS